MQTQGEGERGMRRSGGRADTKIVNGVKKEEEKKRLNKYYHPFPVTSAPRNYLNHQHTTLYDVNTIAQSKPELLHYNHHTTTLPPAHNGGGDADVYESDTLEPVPGN